MTMITVVCDCGCGTVFTKLTRPCKHGRHQHHFVSPEHYYQWMKYNQKKPDHTCLNRLKEMGEVRKLIHGGVFI